MPFRERAKRLFKSRTRSDSLSQTSSNNTSSSSQRWPSNVYAPGEPMPRPKYRKPPTKEHKEKLESFSFADAWRRKSFQSNYSPMGTRAPSRRASLWSLGSGQRKRSYQGASRANSVSTVGDGEGKVGVRQREGGFSGMAVRGTRLSTEEEAEGDDDVTNVGLSRVQSRDRGPASRPMTGGSQPPSANMPYQNMTTAHDHKPFSEHDLSLALQRSHLAVPTH